MYKRQIHISEVMKAIRTIAIAEGYDPPGPFAEVDTVLCLSLIHISEPTRLLSISYAVFCLKKKIQKLALHV